MCFGISILAFRLPGKQLVILTISIRVIGLFKFGRFHNTRLHVAEIDHRKTKKVRGIF